MAYWGGKTLLGQKFIADKKDWEDYKFPPRSQREHFNTFTWVGSAISFGPIASELRNDRTSWVTLASGTTGAADWDGDRDFWTPLSQTTQEVTLGRRRGVSIGSSRIELFPEVPTETQKNNVVTRLSFDLYHKNWDQLTEGQNGREQA